METVVYFALAISWTILFTSAICHLRIARKKKVSYGTVFASAFCVGSTSFVVLMICITRSLVFWGAPKEKPTLGECLYGASETSLICFVPALLVVAWYQAKYKEFLKKP